MTKNRLHDVYIGLGSNLGDKEENMRRALENIEKRIGKVVACSDFYVTAPLGLESTNPFLIAAFNFRISLNALV